MGSEDGRNPTGWRRMHIQLRGSLILFLILLTGACVAGPDSSCTDSTSSSVVVLPQEPQVLVVGERRSVWLESMPDLRQPIEVEVELGRTILELGRERPFGTGMVRLDVEGIRPGTATIRARLPCGESRQLTLTVLADGDPVCETEGPPPYCIEGRYRIRAIELNDRCTGEVSSFESVAEIVRSSTEPIGASLELVDHFVVDGRIGPDGAFFTELPYPIGTFRDGHEVILEPIAIRVAGFRVRGRLDVISLFPSPDPVDFAPCDRRWELEGERL